MTSQLAQALVHQYVEAWLANDKPRILETLAPDCLIVESHGPRFDGLPAIAAWIDEWIALGSRVTSWRIDSFIYENRKAAIEWRFTCTHLQIHHNILGASVFTFSINNQISSIAEYRQSPIS